MHDGNGRGGRGGNGGGNGRGPGRPRRKGDWWRRWTWKKALATSALTGVGFIILILIGIFYTYSQTPIPAASQLATGQASRVYFRDGHTLVGMFGQNDRQTLQPNQIPAMVSNAMVAAEDKHFYDEGGVSPVGIMRAAIADLTSGSVQQGGLHHHPAARPELLLGHRHRGDRDQEDQGDLRRGEAGLGGIQGLDPHQLHEHRPDRASTCTASGRPVRRTSASRSAS